MIFKRGSEGPFHWLVKGLQRKCFNIDDKCAYCTGFAAGGEFHFHLLYFFDAIAVVKETWMGLYGTKAKHSFEVFVTLLHLSFLFADIKQSLGGREPLLYFNKCTSVLLIHVVIRQQQERWKINCEKWWRFESTLVVSKYEDLFTSGNSKKKARWLLWPLLCAANPLELIVS